MALDFPNAPTNGQTFTGAGALWLWDGTKWIGNGIGIGAFLPISGGTMLGPIVLAGDATAALNPVSLQQLNTKAGAYLPLTGGTVTGPTIIMGTTFNAKNNVIGAGTTAPGADILGPSWHVQSIITALGGVLGTNIYYGSGPAWKAPAAGFGFLFWQDTASGIVQLNSYASAAAGAAFSGAYTWQFRRDGSFYSPGAISSATTITSGTHIYCSGTLLINPANSWEWYFARDGSGNHQYVHRANWWDQWNSADGFRSWNGPNGSLMSVDGSGNLSAKGTIATAGNIQGAWVYSTGQVRADATSVAYGGMISYGGRVSAEGTNEPTLFCHWPGVYAGGIKLNSAGSILFVQVDGAGSWIKTLGYFDTSGNFWATSAVTAPYIHSTGGCDVDGRMRASNGVMSSSGAFYVANNDAYYLARDGNNGQWTFVEGGQWNFSVATNGDTSTRSTSYAQNQFAYGNVYAANDWAVQFGGGGNGRILQFAPNYYFNYYGSTGEVTWVSSGGGMFRQRNSDWLAWNQTGPVGGVGGYQNYSDMRGKQDITHTEIGLPEIMKMKPARFTRTIKPELAIGRFFPDGRPQPDFIPRSEIGFIAQELQEALPEAVVEVADFVDGEARLMMTLDPIVAALVNAVKTLNARLAKVEGRH